MLLSMHVCMYAAVSTYTHTYMQPCVIVIICEFKWITGKTFPHSTNSTKSEYLNYSFANSEYEPGIFVSHSHVILNLFK